MASYVFTFLSPPLGVWGYREKATEQKATGHKATDRRPLRQKATGQKATEPNVKMLLSCQDVLERL